MGVREEDEYLLDYDVVEETAEEEDEGGQDDGIERQDDCELLRVHLPPIRIPTV